MTIWQYLLLLAAGLLVIFLACVNPQRFFRVLGKMATNALAGLALLVVLNAVSGFTGFTLPINGMTLAVSSVLGAPGMVAVACLAAI